MFAVLLDFNGTMFFDSSLHQEAWSRIYRELYPQGTDSPDESLFCGPRNDVILQNLAPWLSAEEREQYSERKESLYRQACLNHPEKLHLVPGTEAFLDRLLQYGIPYALASASIKPNIDFFFEVFSLGKWFRREDVVYDDGTYPDKGAMHLEAARRMGVTLADCLLVEDSPSSIALARQNGAGSIIALGHTASPSRLLELADHWIEDFTGFEPAWLLRNTSDLN
ncbi:MAG: HAD family phosphatase [Oscillospiraceae bacterium]|nr:HAD family phosphatase [Oscillospiraceae bacterium]